MGCAKGSISSLRRRSSQFLSISDRRLLRLRRTGLLDLPAGGNYELGFVKTTSGFVEACRLVHDRYMEMGLIDKQVSGLWITPYHLNKDSKAVVGIMRIYGRAVSSATLVQDSDIGLPSERVYPKEIAKLKEDGRRVVEITSLAAAPCREAPNAFLYALKLLGVYAVALGCEDLVISIHPKHARFYEDIFLFEPLGPVREYPGLKNAPAQLERQDLTTFVSRLKAAYQHFPGFANLYEFYLGKNESFLNKIRQLIAENKLTPITENWPSGMLIGVDHDTNLDASSNNLIFV